MTELMAAGGEITSTSWAPDRELSFDEWQQAGETLQRIGRAWQWWVGDWLNYGEAMYGEKYSQALDSTGLGYEALRNAAWVANAIELSTRVDSLSWSHHREVAKLEPAEQERWLASAVADGLTVRDLRVAIRQHEQDQLEAPPIPEGEYSVILADPPWRYEGSETKSRKIENHYPTMELEDICALEVPAAEDCVLFLWATAPLLPEALQVVQAWGFTYRTCMVWVKDRIGMGYYARGRHELLLIAKRGQASPPQPEARPDSVIEAARGRHSEKPSEAYELIEAMYPNARRLEMFSRLAREGWTVWGNEV